MTSGEKIVLKTLVRRLWLWRRNYLKMSLDMILKLRTKVRSDIATVFLKENFFR